jgi:hypothetical protein
MYERKAYAFVVTHADVRRPALTFRVEFENDAKVKEWLESAKQIPEARAHLWKMETAKGCNTSIVIFWADGSIEQRVADWRWEQVEGCLVVADDLPRGVTPPGRPEKRVLLSTTSKERRQGQKSRSY